MEENPIAVLFVALPFVLLYFAIVIWLAVAVFFGFDLLTNLWIS